MNFISLQFLLFFTIIFAGYYFIQHFYFKTKLSEIFLLLASLVFYGFANIKFLPFLLFFLLATYGFSFTVKKNKALFICSIIVIILPLLFFKYINFIISPFTTQKLTLIFPLGISFITFQCLSYLIDLRKEKIDVEKDPVTVFLFVSFFPVISSGPIQMAGVLIPQLKEKHLFNYDSVTNGMKLFAWGFFKKIFIADSLAVYVNEIYNAPFNHYGIALLTATIFYSFQIYCDFSGYSDMAIGISNILGFDVGKNFDHPYLSKSCTEFWKRWHISLSSWLKDYIYIPLGGSRVSAARTYVNLLITFIVSGMWHGAAKTFIVWGILHGLYQCFARIFKSFTEKFPDALRIIVTFCLITFAWIFFRANCLSHALTIIKKILFIPKEIISIPNMISETGFIQTVSTLFSINIKLTEAVNFCFMGLKILLLIVIELITFKKPGLEKLKDTSPVLRWILYVLLSVFIVTFFLQNSVSSISTNFIYNNF